MAKVHTWISEWIENANMRLLELHVDMGRPRTLTAIPRLQVSGVS